MSPIASNRTPSPDSDVQSLPVQDPETSRKRSRRSSTSSRQSLPKRRRPGRRSSRASKQDPDSDSEFPCSSSTTSKASTSTTSSIRNSRQSNKQSELINIFFEVKANSEPAAATEKAVEKPDKEDSSSDSDDQEEDVYVVERIDGKQVLEGVTYYFIKWKGWDESSNTWEPIENLDGCSKILEDFEAREGSKGKRRNLSKAQQEEMELYETQQHMKSYGIMGKWPGGREPTSVEGVIHVDGELVYIVRRRTRMGGDLDRSNAVLVRGEAFKQSHPDLVIDFYESRVVWADSTKSPEEEAYVAAEMALFSQNVGSLVGKQVAHQMEGELKMEVDCGNEDDDNQSIELGDPSCDLFGLPQDLEDTDLSGGDSSENE